jgi:hypothetical protein
MKLGSMKMVAGLALALVSSMALAEVTFDAATGTGFVGKGDVQDAFGWDNHDLQANAGGLSFSYGAIQDYAFTCQWFTGPAHNRRKHEVTETVSVGISGSVNHEARIHMQIDGFHMTGYGDVFTESGTVPAVGGSCPQGNSGVIIAVQSLGGEGGLYVQYGEQKVLLPQ